MVSDCKVCFRTGVELLQVLAALYLVHSFIFSHWVFQISRASFVQSLIFQKWRYRHWALRMSCFLPSISDLGCASLVVISKKKTLDTNIFEPRLCFLQGFILPVVDFGVALVLHLLWQRDCDILNKFFIGKVPTQLSCERVKVVAGFIRGL